MLKTVAKLILELVPEGIRVYRLEGDHFGILVKYPNEEIVKNCMMQYARAASVTGGMEREDF